MRYRCSLKNGTNVEDHHRNRESPLARVAISDIRHEDTANKSAQQQHSGHKSGPESRFGEGVGEIVS